MQLKEFSENNAVFSYFNSQNEDGLSNGYIPTTKHNNASFITCIVVDNSISFIIEKQYV